MKSFHSMKIMQTGASHYGSWHGRVFDQSSQCTSELRTFTQLYLFLFFFIAHCSEKRSLFFAQWEIVIKLRCNRTRKKWISFLNWSGFGEWKEISVSYCQQRKKNVFARKVEVDQPQRTFISVLNEKYLLSQCYDAFCRRSPFLSARNMHLFHCFRRYKSAWDEQKKICWSSVLFVASKRHKMYSCRKPLHGNDPYTAERLVCKFYSLFFSQIFQLRRPF